MALLKRLTVFAPRGVRVLSSSSPRDELDLTFNSPKEAFKSKKTSELIRAYLVYEICGIDWIVENNAMLMKKTRKMVGKRLFELIMKATFYGQFVAGEDPEKIRPTIERLQQFGVKPILDYSVEEDLSQEEAEKREIDASVSTLGEKKEEGSLKQFHVEQKFADRRYKVTGARTYFYLNEASCEKNAEAFLRSIDAVAKITKSTGLMAVKLTALGRPQLLLQLSEVIMRARNYMQQIAGGTGNVLTHHKTIEDMQRYFGDLSNKPEVQDFMKKMTSDKQGIVHLFPWSNILDKDMNLSETFRVPDPSTGRMRRLISQISTKEEEMFRNMLHRLNNIIQTAHDKNVRVMIDAEQTYFQPAISRICTEMMRRYNKNKFLVFNTYQTYLKNAYNEMITDLEQAERQNFKWGAKLVRGAYLEQERARASAMNYEDPTCPNFEATTASFNKCMEEVLERNAKSKNTVGIMVASHNENTIRYSIQLMAKHGTKHEDKAICFGQLLGMCDHVTFPLGQSGYSVYKYVPYGPVDEVLPYLSRRATENRGFLSKIKKEKRLLRNEVLRRLFTGNVFHKPEGNYNPVIVHLFPWSNIMDADMNLSDSFRVPDPATGQMRRLISQITPKEEEMFRNMLQRLNHIIQVANEVDVRIMIDAEQTYFQPAISRICMEMMRRYNKNKFLVFNTYQTYLKSTYNELITDLEQAERQNFKWGAKLVRGAYIEQERARAAAMGYEDPSCPNFEATTASFNKCLEEVLSRNTGARKGTVGIMVASHNEDTVRYAIELMEKYGTTREDKAVCFGQLLGMCDHITFPLGQSGYSVYKYVPYGPVEEVLPYLSRRATENRGFLSKIKKEKRLIRNEILRRIFTGNMFHKPVGKYTPA